MHLSLPAVAAKQMLGALAQGDAGQRVVLLHKKPRTSSNSAFCFELFRKFFAAVAAQQEPGALGQGDVGQCAAGVLRGGRHGPGAQGGRRAGGALLTLFPVVITTLCC